jgi:MFS family permease
MVAAEESTPAVGTYYESWRLRLLGLLALLILVPVTLPVPILRALVHERFGVSETLTSLFMSINMVGAFVAAPLGGILADRFGRRRELIVAALVVDGLCFIALPLVGEFGVFMAVRFVEGCAHILALSLLLALAATSQREERRGRAMGLVGGGLLLGVALGAPIGGALGGRSVILPLHFGAGLLFAAAALAAATLRETGRDRERPSIAELVETVARHRRVLVPLAFAFADRFTVGFYTTTLSLYLTRVHDATPGQIGALIASFMLPFAIFSYPFGRLAERHSIATMLCAGSVLYGIGTAAVGFSAIAGLFFLMPAIGVAAAVMFVPTMVMTTNLVPESVRTTALGAFNAAGSLGFIVGPLTGGMVSQAVADSHGWLTGYRAAFAVAGVSEILCVALAIPFLLRLRARGLTT